MSRYFVGAATPRPSAGRALPSPFANVKIPTSPATLGRLYSAAILFHERPLGLGFVSIFHATISPRIVVPGVRLLRHRLCAAPTYDSQQPTRRFGLHRRSGDRYTPVSTPFTYYGTRKIQLIKDGFETLTVYQNFPAPWYQYPVIEFFSDNFWPRETRDERILDFQLYPQQIVSPDQIRQRGEQLRSSARQGVVTPLFTPGATTPPQP